MSKKNIKIDVKGVEVTFTKNQQEEFICITDIAKCKFYCKMMGLRA